MHHLLTCSAYVFAISSVLLGFMPADHLLLAGLGIAVAVVGVPHGGLDHWAGRRLLHSRMGGAWWSLFFPCYLTVAIIVAVGWNWLPLLTAILFFALSAWHFGLDDEQIGREAGWPKHLSALALGGLVIWVPAVCRSGEMQTILATIIPAEMTLSAAGIVTITRGMAMLLLPVAGFAILLNMRHKRSRKIGVRYLLVALVSALAPIIVSFGLYFCFWHSVRGLQHLYGDSSLTPARFTLAVLPLSLLAIAMVAAGAFVWNNNGGVSSEATRALFIGLSAIAVPHLLLHGLKQVKPVWLTNAADNVSDNGSQWVTS